MYALPAGPSVVVGVAQALKMAEGPDTSAPSTGAAAAPQPTANWQYQALSRNSADVTTALAAIKLAGILAGHLKARGIIGQHVFEQATNYAPDVTEYARVQHLITAVLNKTKYNPQWYHDFIKVLELDGLHPDTEAARSLLPAAAMPSTATTTSSSGRNGFESYRLTQAETHQAEMRAQNGARQRKGNLTPKDETIHSIKRRKITSKKVTSQGATQNTAAQTQLRGEIRRLEQLTQHRQKEMERSELAHSIEIAETRLQLQETLQTKLMAQAETHQAKMRTQNETHQAEMRTLNETLQAEMRVQNESLQTEVTRLRGVTDSLQATVVSKNEIIRSNAREFSSKDATLTQKESELASKNTILERQSSTIREQNEQLTRAREFLSGQKPQPHPLHPRAKITWEPCTDLPVKMDEAQTAVIGDKVYCSGAAASECDQYLVFCYSPSEDTWNTLPVCDVRFFGLGQVRGKLVTVGGMKSDGSVTKGVQEVTHSSKQLIPSMPTARFSPAVLSHHSTLTVAGGYTEDTCTSVVEVFREETSEWYTTEPLPFRYYDVSSLLIDNRWYLLGGQDDGGDDTNRAVCAHVDLLLQKALPRDQASTDSDSTNNSAWEILPNTPHYGPATATFGGSLLAVGGTSTKGTPENPQTTAHVYSPCTNAWIHISDLPAPRMSAATAMLSPTELLVIGGWNKVLPFYQTTIYKGLLRIE